jgi:hypothetical protein
MEQSWLDLDKMVSECFEMLNLRSYLNQINLDYVMQDREVFVDRVLFKLVLLNMINHFLVLHTNGTISVKVNFPPKTEVKPEEFTFSESLIIE